jgi:thiopurine S-methyltransferase
VDMAYLARHPNVNEVVGIDGVKRALEEFIAENPSLDIVEGQINGSMETYHGKSIKLLRGDFFDTDDHDTGGQFDSIFDRASMVAIRPELRTEYVETIGKLVKPGGSILLVTVDRREGTDSAIKAGPPFSVNEGDVRNLYESLSWVESVTKIEEIDEFENEPGSKARWESMGLRSLYELCFLIKIKK